MYRVSIFNRVRFHIESNRETNHGRFAVHRFKSLVLLLSIAVISGVMLSTGGSVSAAVSDIESAFSMVGNPIAISEDTMRGATGSGTFTFNGSDLDNLDFTLDIQAEDLLPNTMYDIGITVREGNGPPHLVVPLTVVVAASAMTDAQGNLDVDGTGVIPNVFGSATPGDKWRIDQEVFLPGVGTVNTCVDCVLVCAPTTKIVLTNDGQLALFGSGDDDATSEEITGANHLSRSVIEDVSSDLGFVNVINNDAGAKLVLVIVNGKFAGVDRIEPGETVSIDITDQTDDGSDNSVAISIVAQPGSTTKIWLSSTAP